MSSIVAPSILSADFGNLAKDISMLNSSNADWIHIDVMDGNYVPNISFGMPVIDYIDSLSNKPLDIHLMISKPERYIERFLDYNTKVLTVHLEASKHLHRTIEEIKSRGVMAGVAINPHTDVNHLSEIIKDVDLVCLMSVNPGFSGQKFIENSFSKVKKLKNLILTKKSKCEIQVDGGVNIKNAKELVKNGAEILVAGNYIFKSNNPHEKINLLKKI
ncbi:ribulose-phosphate 3-epimerase [Bacteroidota bacterium]|nr:ribulose-phosphate 3-epimerase [Bacteroidota bacterium]